MIEQGGLRPFDRVLDVGCGLGRMAAPLTQYLRGPGFYVGFDIDRELVTWCQQNISSANPRFRFRHVDVRSSRYNPDGAVRGSEFVFPYDSDSFSVVLATSVFTHLLSYDTEGYIAQIRRVLMPGGVLLATFFLINDEAQALIAEGKAAFAFPSAGGVCWPLRQAEPEYAVASLESWVQELLARHDFGSPVQVHYGSWCGRSRHLSFQDIVIARRGSDDDLLATGPNHGLQATAGGGRATD